MTRSTRFVIVGAVAFLLGLAAPAHATGYSKFTFDLCTQSQCSVPDTDLRPKASIKKLLVNTYISAGGRVNIYLCMRPYNSTFVTCDDAAEVDFINLSSQPVYKEFVITPSAWGDPGSVATQTPFFTYGGNAQFLSWEVDY